jgi:hypothetical protein
VAVVDFGFCRSALQSGQRLVEDAGTAERRDRPILRALRLSPNDPATQQTLARRSGQSKTIEKNLRLRHNWSWFA